MSNLFKRLQSQNVDSAKLNCLLLDTSGSMDAQDVVLEDTINERSRTVRRIDALKEAVEGLMNRTGLPVFQFNTWCGPVENIANLRPTGTTHLGGAFEYLKFVGRDAAILVTDGEPDNEFDALKHARGLHLDIIYIGNGEMPDFLTRLARECGGTAGALSLNKPLEIERKITGLLGAPKVVQI